VPASDRRNYVSIALGPAPRSARLLLRHPSLGVAVLLRRVGTSCFCRQSLEDSEGLCGSGHGVNPSFCIQFVGRGLRILQKVTRGFVCRMCDLMPLVPYTAAPARLQTLILQ